MRVNNSPAEQNIAVDNNLDGKVEYLQHTNEFYATM